MSVKLTPIYRILLAFAISLAASSVCRGQIYYQPYSFSFDQKLTRDIYSPQADIHTAFKPFLFADSGRLGHSVDSILNRTTDTTHKSWLYRKIFNEHLFDSRTREYTFYLDYLPDLQVGREFSSKTNTWLNTRGYQAGGTIGPNFFFYSSGFENQGQFANYYTEYIQATGLVPGQAYNFDGKLLGSKDWMYATALAGYKFSDAVTIEAGIDKAFIGDGYRSMLLSDYASDYPLLRGRFNLGKHVQYVAMWAYMQDRNAVQLDTAGHTPFRVKWAVFHYIDWNITNRASLGFFNALIAPDAYDNGAQHGFDVNYINPILFVKSLAPGGPIPDNTLIGFNARYKVLDETSVYGQVLFDQSSGDGQTKQGFQLGLRGANLAGINSFNYLFEFNTATPGTYGNTYTLVNYADMNEPLAHPFGNNFHEYLGILSYSIGRFDIRGELDYATYFLANSSVYKGAPLTPAVTLPTNPTGPQSPATLKFAQGIVSYLINSKTNLRIEAGGILRDESNSSDSQKTVWFTFGLRGSFRDLYNDF